jgi:hypothetical protein
MKFRQVEIAGGLEVVGGLLALVLVGRIVRATPIAERRTRRPRRAAENRAALREELQPDGKRGQTRAILVRAALAAGVRARVDPSYP